MPALNEPTGFDEPQGDDDWTPARGLARGAIAGTLVTVVLVAGLTPLVVLVPYLFIVLLARGALTFVIAWVLLRVVNHAAGMVARPCSAIALSLTALVLLSHHVVFAVHGVPALAGAIDSPWLYPVPLVESLIGEQNGLTIGWRWFHPFVLLALNAAPILVGVVSYKLYGRE